MPTRDPKTADTEPRSAFFGRRVGKTLRGQQQDAIARLLPARRFALEDAADPAALFAHRPREIRLEIGFGGGEHLIAHAARRPEAGFIGVEPFLNGMARMLVDLEQSGLANIRVIDLDAALVLARLPAGSLAGADLFYPDPWPKRRHWKRRFVNPENLDLIARALAPGAEFRFASDVPHYVGWTLAEVRRHGAFRWTARTAADWMTPHPHWSGTRYEQKARAQGRTPTYLTFVRT